MPVTSERGCGTVTSRFVTIDFVLPWLGRCLGKEGKQPYGEFLKYGNFLSVLGEGGPINPGAGLGRDGGGGQGAAAGDDQAADGGERHVGPRRRLQRSATKKGPKEEPCSGPSTGGGSSDEEPSPWCRIAKMGVGVKARVPKAVSWRGAHCGWDEIGEGEAPTGEVGLGSDRTLWNVCTLRTSEMSETCNGTLRSVLGDADETPKSALGKCIPERQSSVGPSGAPSLSPILSGSVGMGEAEKIGRPNQHLLPMLRISKVLAADPIN